MAHNPKVDVTTLRRGDIERIAAETPPSGKHRGIIAIAAVAPRGWRGLGVAPGGVNRGAADQ